MLYDVSRLKLSFLISYALLLTLTPIQPSGEPTLTPTSAEPSVSPTTAVPTTSPSSRPTTSAPTTITCLQVITGSGNFDGGYIDVYVNTGDGYRNVSQIDLKYDSGEEVTLVDDGCYENLINVQIDSSRNDAWSGSIKAFVRDPNVIQEFVPMTCTSDSCAGDFDATDNIVIDGGSDPDVGDIAALLECLPGVIVDGERMGPCKLEVAEVEEEIDTPVVSFCCLRGQGHDIHPRVSSHSHHFSSLLNTSLSLHSQLVILMHLLNRPTFQREAHQHLHLQSVQQQANQAHPSPLQLHLSSLIRMQYVSELKQHYQTKIHSLISSLTVEMDM